MFKNCPLASVKKYQLIPILSDERGLFFEVLNKVNITHVIVTTFTKNAVRGNQFRKTMDQYFFLTSGKLKLITKKPDDPDDFNSSGNCSGTTCTKAECCNSSNMELIIGIIIAVISCIILSIIGYFLLSGDEGGTDGTD